MFDRNETDLKRSIAGIGKRRALAHANLRYRPPANILRGRKSCSENRNSTGFWQTLKGVPCESRRYLFAIVMKRWISCRRR